MILETKRRVNSNADIEKYLAHLCKTKEPLQIGSTETNGIDRYVTLQQRNGVSVNTKVYQLGSNNEKMRSRILYDVSEVAIKMLETTKPKFSSLLLVHENHQNPNWR